MAAAALSLVMGKESERCGIRLEDARWLFQSLLGPPVASEIHHSLPMHLQTPAIPNMGDDRNGREGGIYNYLSLLGDFRANCLLSTAIWRQPFIQQLLPFHFQPKLSCDFTFPQGPKKRMQCILMREGRHTYNACSAPTHTGCKWSLTLDAGMKAYPVPTLLLLLPPN